MKFLIDESSGRKLFLFLKEKGFDVKFVAEIIPRVSDKEVLEFSEKENRILVTNDKDFGELIFRSNRPSFGVILLRLNLDTPKNRQNYVLAVIKRFSDRLEGSFIVVTEGKVRIRKLK